MVSEQELSRPWRSQNSREATPDRKANSPPVKGEDAEAGEGGGPRPAGWAFAQAPWLPFSGTWSKKLPVVNLGAPICKMERM